MEITLEIHQDDCSDYCVITQEQYEDIMFLASTTADSYSPIHSIMQGIIKAFEEVEDETL